MSIENSKLDICLTGKTPAAENSSLTRWPIIVSAVLIQICLGAIYSWGVFLSPLMSSFGVNKTRVSLAFSLALIFYTVGMIIGGKWQDKVGPLRVITASGFLIGAGYILTGFSGSIEMIYLTYGVLGGIGLGLGYICPVAVCAKWFPDKKGMAIGLAVAGFGAGSLIVAPIASFLITVAGWRWTFIGLGMLFGLIILIAGSFMNNPPRNLSSGLNLAKNEPTGEGIDWKKMFKTKQFRYFWTIFALLASAGLMFISHLPDFIKGLKFSRDVGPLLLGVLSISNGLGRILLGAISDKFGRLNILLLTALQLGLTLLLITKVAYFPLLVLFCILAGLSFGGIIAIFPILAADHFGSKNLGLNYGLLFTAYGIGGIIGPTIGAVVFDLWRNYSNAFFTGGLFSLTALILIVVVKKRV